MVSLILRWLYHVIDPWPNSHPTGAVDMDVYGAFQLCSLGILAGPVTVRLSKTYFDAPGRNIIFLWTGIILAGKFRLYKQVRYIGTY
jgi:hypothetical protein